MAKRKNGVFAGAIRRREQMKDCFTGLWVKSNSITGEVISIKKNKGTL